MLFSSGVLKACNLIVYKHSMLWLLKIRTGLKVKTFGHQLNEMWEKSKLGTAANNGHLSEKARGAAWKAAFMLLYGMFSTEKAS